MNDIATENPDAVDDLRATVLLFTLVMSIPATLGLALFSLG